MLEGLFDLFGPSEVGERACGAGVEDAQDRRVGGAEDVFEARFGEGSDGNEDAGL